MSESFRNNPEALLIVLLAYAILLGVNIYFRHAGKKKYAFDERYYVINNRIKAKSWDFMFVVLLVAWLVVMIFDGISFSFFLVTGLVVIRSMIQVIFAMHYSQKE